ncbi:hypothetical protein C0995_000838 [Termitomyces sp. Mi166|nr:hypothetical protein C0995_000838 [Termitomyces sp. Mi166\
MARILPRLLARLERRPQPVCLEKYVLARKRPRSLRRPVPPPPSFRAADYARSILLHDPATNPITRSRVYVRHKSLPPLPRRFDRPRKPTRDAPDDRPRPMSRRELRMIASPLRQCVITGRFFPNGALTHPLSTIFVLTPDTDFLIRLAVQRIPRSHCPPNWKRPDVPQTLLPDGLQHTKFTVRRSGKAHYVPCTRTAIALLSDSSIRRRNAYNVPVHPLLAEHIAHLLRLRVLQELEVLADNLEAPTHKKPPPPTGPRLLRRLTHAELHTIRTTQTIPHPGALAVLIVPPLQKDPATGLRPAPNMSPAPPPSTTAPHPKNPVTMPGCVLYPTRPEVWADSEGDGLVPLERVPLYNGVVMFPERGQRAALEALLRRVLEIEWKAGHKHAHPVREEGKVVENGEEEEGGGEEGEGKGSLKKKTKTKTSPAFLLCSDEKSVLRGDTVGVAIALWRLRMFEDIKGEDLETQSVNGWEWTRRKT